MKQFFFTWLGIIIIAVGVSILAKTVVWQLQYGVQEIPDLVNLIISTLWINIGIRLFKFK